jgi:hypothetical protein
MMVKGICVSKSRRFQVLKSAFPKALEVVTHSRIDGPSEIVQDSAKGGDNTDSQTVTIR